MNINIARTLANINDRAQRITEEYRLIWNRHEGAFFVAHKTDRSRRYQVDVHSCACPSFVHHGDCKHHIGLAALVEVEINRYTILGFQEDRRRMLQLQAELQFEEQCKDPAFVDFVEAHYLPAFA